jgi:hypothetical protein
MENLSKSTWVIGDIHGCLTEFKELFDLIKSKTPYSEIICLGDLTDRGPDSIGCIRFVRDNNLKSVMGNHDYKILRWLNQSKKSNHVPDYYHHLSSDDINQLFNLPNYIETDEYFIIHAGIKKDIPIKDQSQNDLLYLRFFDKLGKIVSLKTIHEIGIEKSQAIFWDEYGPFEKNVIYGHHVWSFETPHLKKYDNNKFCIGIDTGCVFGGMLTAFCLETKEILQIKAKKVYYQSYMKN